MMFIYGFIGIIALVAILNIMNSISMSVTSRIKQYGVRHLLIFSNFRIEDYLIQYLSCQFISFSMRSLSFHMQSESPAGFFHRLRQQAADAVKKSGGIDVMHSWNLCQMMVTELIHHTSPDILQDGAPPLQYHGLNFWL